VVADALRLLIAAEAERPTPTVALSTFGGSALRSGVDLEDPEALAAVLDEDDARAAA
jgi:hypothetical protein